jgi:hypothetical protein
LPAAEKGVAQHAQKRVVSAEFPRLRDGVAQAAHFACLVE